VSADPIRRFEEEHDVALSALTRLEAAAEALRGGGAVEPHFATARQVLGLLCGAVRRHNDDEECALFPLLGTEAPLTPFVDEHGTLRRLETELSSALERGDAVDVIRVSLDIVYLLRAHIERENTVLFPAARDLLGPAGLAEVARRLDLRPVR
jgi:hemerythrin-like domain-containing protein